MPPLNHMGSLQLAQGAHEGRPADKWRAPDDPLLPASFYAQHAHPRISPHRSVGPQPEAYRATTPLHRQAPCAPPCPLCATSLPHHRAQPLVALPGPSTGLLPTQAAPQGRCREDKCPAT